ncbi:MAG: LPS export ABC transporter ATP-binding protein [Planctomycetes bacterium]|nr:LPS export ABC transporter ATP-binding protein [Planctomycetota bacterium]
MAILEVQELVKFYGSRKVVDGVSFKVDIGEVVGLLGPNGAGKTTSFRMTTGQVTPNGGKVIFDGKDVTTLPMFKRARLGMGYLAQETSVFRKLSVEQNIHAILEAQPIHRTLGRKLTRQERIDACDKVLEQFSLSHLKKNNAARLSGGEKRRLEIARCLVCDPLLILLDEPFAGIDPQTIQDIQQIVRGLRGQGIGVLVTDHRVREILTITDRSYLIKKGNVVTHGTPQELVRDPIAIREYLGNSFSDDPFGLSRSGDEAVRGMQAISGMRSNPPLQEHFNRLLDQLRTPDGAAAAREILAMGMAAVPGLLDAMEKREVDMRRVCWELLKRVHPNPGDYDPSAPEIARLEQVRSMRVSLPRLAG